MPNPAEHIDFREIDTPWEPEPIIWRYTKPEATYRSVSHHGERNIFALFSAVQDPTKTHIVREVEVITHKYHLGMSRSVDDISASLAETEAQYRQLEELTPLRVAPRQWHVFSDEGGRTRTLARVEIIEGDDLLEPFAPESSANETNQQHIRSIKESIELYRDKTVGRPLLDIEFGRQYRLGIPRTQLDNSLANQALYLVDIEPVTYIV